jgi:hypothetical protein
VDLLFVLTELRPLFEADEPHGISGNPHASK